MLLCGAADPLNAFYRGSAEACKKAAICLGSSVGSSRGLKILVSVVQVHSEAPYILIEDLRLAGRKASPSAEIMSRKEAAGSEGLRAWGVKIHGNLSLYNNRG